MAERKSNTCNNAKGSGKPRRLTHTEMHDKGSVGGSISLIPSLIVLFVGIILLVVSCMPTTEGALTSLLASALHCVFGITCYIFSVLLSGLGIYMIAKRPSKRSLLKLCAGLFLIFIALSGIIGMSAPYNNISGNNYSLLFSESNLSSFAGYVGNGFAWILLVLLGKVIGVIVCIFLIVIGLILTGYSANLFKKIFASFKNKKNKPNNVTTEPQSAQIRLDKNGDIDISSFENFPVAGGKTTVLSKFQDSPIMSDEKPRVRPSVKTRNSRLNDQDGVSESDFSPKTRKLDNTDTQAPTNLLAEANNSDKTAIITPSVPEKAEDEPSDVIVASNFKLPSMSLLAKPEAKKKSKRNDAILEEIGVNLQRTLSEFGVNARVVDWIKGPTVTLYEVELPAGVRVNKIQGLGTDIALALAVASVRIFAPIPGTNYVGVEIPNSERETVVLSEVLKSAKQGVLQIAIGKDVEGNCVCEDLSKMPHLLIGGTTGSGKSVSVNAMIMSILMRATPDEVRFIMIDPKRVEFTPYNGIPHLYAPVVTEPAEASNALSWAVAEMERRLKLMSEVAARNIKEYNTKISTGELGDITKTDIDGNAVKKHIHLPYIVIIIDELADLMMSVGKEVEMSICRLAQLARAAGIHLIVATQRPSTNVVTGLIKSNITNRIAFNVASSIDSRVILDTTGAEDLIGLGDLLLSKPDYAKPLRMQGCFVSESEISQVVKFIKDQGEPEYHSEILDKTISGIGDTSTMPTGGDLDPYFWDAAGIVCSNGSASTSNIQRRLKVGYSRAARIMDQLEDEGIIGAANGSKPREVLVDALELESIKALKQND